MGTLRVRVTGRIASSMICASFVERNRVLDRTHGLGHGLTSQGYGSRLTAYGIATAYVTAYFETCWTRCPSSGITSFVIASRTAPSEPGNAMMILPRATPAQARLIIAADPISS